MADKLHADVVLGGSANGGSAWGLVTLYDNHKNSTRGENLTCSGEAPVKLTTDQLIRMHNAINPYAFKALNLDGTIPLPEGVESPLQSMCREIHAKKHHDEKKAATKDTAHKL